MLIAAGITAPQQLTERTQTDADAAGTVVAVALKEPPLVAFTTDASPFASAREAGVEGLTGQDAQVLDEAVRRLPVPVVGMPWSYLDHLPRSVSIAHEVGHVVAWDFKVREVIKTAFARLPRSVPDARRAGWEDWCHELFADAYGIQCMGVGFVLALADFLVGDPNTLSKQRQGPVYRRTHPTSCG